jgi:hypothetical protein
MWQRFNNTTVSGQQAPRQNTTNAATAVLSRSLSNPATQAGQIVGARGSRYAGQNDDDFLNENATFSSPVQPNRIGSRFNNSAQ